MKGLGHEGARGMKGLGHERLGHEGAGECRGWGNLQQSLLNHICAFFFLRMVASDEVILRSR